MRCDRCVYIYIYIGVDYNPVILTFDPNFLGHPSRIHGTNGIFNGIDIYYIYIYIPGSRTTIVLVGKGIVLEGLSLKIEDKKVPGIHIYI